MGRRYGSLDAAHRVSGGVSLVGRGHQRPQPWEVLTIDESILVERLRQHWEYLGVDVDRAHEMYHDDAVLEFPQSGERFEGLVNFREWRRQYPADLRFRVRRMIARENLAVVECSISYNGGPWQYGVQLLEFRGDKVARERVYVMEAWPAPAWRAPWRATTRADGSE